jgi:hypothetical protein
MSPPEVWGPPVWTLFHTLAEKMREDAYGSVVQSTFHCIKSICKYLPCPECSHDATRFLEKVQIQNYKTKNDFKVMLYLFHNYVNAKKKKPLYNFTHLSKYASLNMNMVVNNFINKYHTRGNLKLLTETFQRGFVVKNFITWYKKCYFAFNDVSKCVPLLEGGQTSETVADKSVQTEEKNEQDNL